MEVDGSAAERRPDVADDPKKRDYMLRLNVQVPEYLAHITKRKGILLIYISSGIYPFPSMQDQGNDRLRV